MGDPPSELLLLTSVRLAVSLSESFVKILFIGGVLSSLLNVEGLFLSPAPGRRYGDSSGLVISGTRWRSRRVSLKTWFNARLTSTVKSAAVHIVIRGRLHNGEIYQQNVLVKAFLRKNLVGKYTHF